MEEAWRSATFSKQPASEMQELLGHGATIPYLLDQIDHHTGDKSNLRLSLMSTMQTLQDWEDGFSPESKLLYEPISPKLLGLEIDTLSLPDVCFTFPNVSAANALAHCWAFRIVCHLELLRPSGTMKETTILPSADPASTMRRKTIIDLCTIICRALPYLLQEDMGLYGPMSATFPLRMVFESIKRLQLVDGPLGTWCNSIKDQLLRLGVPVDEA